MSNPQTQANEDVEVVEQSAEEHIDDASAAEAAPETDEATEAAAPEPVELSPEQKRIEELEQEVETIGETLRSYAERVDRMRSEFEASKTRLKREHERTLEGDKVKAVTGLLGVLDSLDQALANAPSTEAAFVDGLNLIRRDFEGALNELGLVRFDPKGETFDPERHEALTVMAVPDEAQHNCVVHVMKQGALVGDKVVRAATVVVGQHTSA